MRYRLFRLWRGAGLGRARRRGRVLAHRLWFRLRLPLVFLALLLSLMGIVFRTYLPQPIAHGLEQVGVAVQEGMDRAIPVLARSFQPDSDQAYRLVQESLPRAGVDGGVTPLYEAFLATVQSLFYQLIGYDPARPVTVIEAELVGYAAFARSAPGGGSTSQTMTTAPGIAGGPQVSPSDPPQMQQTLPRPPVPEQERAPERPPIPEPERTPEPIPPPVEPREPLDLDAVLRMAAWGAEPLIAIFHTHPSEMYRTDSFAPADSYSYHRFGTTDTGIVRVGQRLADTLRETYGIPVVHNRELHDTPCHSCAYVESRKTVQALLRQYPSLKIIVDVHRDGAEDISMLAAVGEEAAAQIALVVGRPTNQSRHPRWTENDAFARRVSEIMHLRQPGLLRRIIYLNGVYNQDLHPRAMLVEVGNYYDHEAYALRSAELLAAVLAEALYEEVFGRAPSVEGSFQPASTTPNP